MLGLPLLPLWDIKFYLIELGVIVSCVPEIHKLFA